MRPTLVLLALALLIALPAVALGHAERATMFPDPTHGKRPVHRNGGPSLVVCKPESAKRVKRSWRGSSKTLTRRRAYILNILEKRCKYRHIQQAVDAAKTGDRILIMPGIYKEEPSRKIPVKDPKCAGDEYWEASGDNHTEDGRVPTYKHQVDCPNARNLIAVIGDDFDDPDRECDHKCNLQMQGMGRKPDDVQIIGDRLKQDVIRADRADGFQLDNVLVEQGGYNNVDFVETNGFRITRVITRYAKNYGILTFTSDNGLYDSVKAYGSGDSGIYPGSGPEGHCARYGIVVQNSESYGNTLGSSGTAGNGTWYPTTRCTTTPPACRSTRSPPATRACRRTARSGPTTRSTRTTSTSTTTRTRRTATRPRSTSAARRSSARSSRPSSAPGSCSTERTRTSSRTTASTTTGGRGSGSTGCRRPRAGSRIRPSSRTPRTATRIVDNFFGIGPSGPLPNGQDITWDEQGIGNCWQDNKTAADKRLTSDPALLPTCLAGGSNALVSNPAKTAAELPCVEWHPKNNPDPPGCSWFTTPPKPES